MILDEIMAYKRQELQQQQQAVPLAELKARGADRPPSLDFAAALRGRGVRLIAEVKKASPSKGVFRPDLDPVQLAQTYAANGAAAVSVLTDHQFFQGKLEYLRRIKTNLSNPQYPVPYVQSPLPILRKDFIFDPYQVHESYTYGADALLLIVAILNDAQLGELLDLTHLLGMTALIEVHNEEELERALRLRPKVIGINNRNLQDFSVDLGIFGHLHPFIPDHVVTVAESGVHTAADVRCLVEMGADAILVGEALVTAPDVASKVQELVKSGDQRGRLVRDD